MVNRIQEKKKCKLFLFSSGPHGSPEALSPAGSAAKGAGTKGAKRQRSIQGEKNMSPSVKIFTIYLCGCVNVPHLPGTRRGRKVGGRGLCEDVRASPKEMKKPKGQEVILKLRLQGPESSVHHFKI